ncbi:vanadium-dependent haloperoxidase [Micromonospora phytophila]|uniref:vanadium-dependent haloperoxidase n=1 Tax=Micromonospora phytophila TaxID=709888 RepID=UPI00202E15A9|nr:vanadium-dependent haloperoxidase [Micromonospora phytophila]MCM0675657.1 vanadium-dependent haloperoxidase [Micromonospora phytophila]
MRSILSRRALVSAVALATIGALTACQSASGTTPTGQISPSHTDPGHADPSDNAARSVPVGWVLLASGQADTAKLSPPAASRLMAYTTIAMHEAVAAAEPAAGSFDGQLTGMPAMPPVEAGGRLDAEATAAAAARDVVIGLLGPDASTPSRSAIDTLYSLHQERRTSDAVPDTVLRSSEVHGEKIALAILGWAASDGIAGRNAPYKAPSGLGRWELAPPATAAVEPHWGKLRTFALTHAQQVQPVAPPAYSAEPGSEFAAQARQVYDASRALTDQQRASARFWAMGPAMRWMTIAADQVEQKGLAPERATRALALTAVALADAALASWAAKYQHTVMRPITYIQRHIDPTWTPLLPTPGHPEFPAGHSASATAAATVLTAQFGTVPVTARDATGIEPDRRLPSFDAAATETAMSRVYAGVHYPKGLDAGADQGRRIAQLVLQRLGNPAKR